MEYRIAKGWRIAAFISTAVFVFGGGAMIISALTGSPSSPVFLFILGVILIALAIFFYLEATRTKLTIDDHSITLQKAFSTRSLSRRDIRGYCHGEKDILYIVPKEGTGKEIRLSGFLERRKELLEWLEKNYPDVDEIEYEAETKTILANENFGFTKNERETNLNKARKISTWANAAGSVVAFWAFIYPKPYEALLIVLGILPLVGLYIAWRFKGLVRLDARKKSAWPSIAYIICFPSLALMIRSLSDYDLYSYEDIWKVMFVSAPVLTFLSFLICRKAAEKSRPSAWGVGLLIAGCYSFGLITLSNCYYDTSKPVTYQVQVDGKHINSGKSTSYHLTLSPWGRFIEEEDVTVGRSFYNDVREGDQVHIHLHEGRWHIPWYFILH